MEEIIVLPSGVEEEEGVRVLESAVWHRDITGAGRLRQREREERDAADGLGLLADAAFMNDNAGDAQQALENRANEEPHLADLDESTREERQRIDLLKALDTLEPAVEDDGSSDAGNVTAATVLVTPPITVSDQPNEPNSDCESSSGSVSVSMGAYRFRRTALPPPRSDTHSFRRENREPPTLADTFGMCKVRIARNIEIPDVVLPMHIACRRCNSVMWFGYRLTVSYGVPKELPCYRCQYKRCQTFRACSSILKEWQRGLPLPTKVNPAEPRVRQLVRQSMVDAGTDMTPSKRSRASKTAAMAEKRVASDTSFAPQAVPVQNSVAMEADEEQRVEEEMAVAVPEEHMSIATRSLDMMDRPLETLKQHDIEKRCYLQPMSEWEMEGLRRLHDAAGEMARIKGYELSTRPAAPLLQLPYQASRGTRDSLSQSKVLLPPMSMMPAHSGIPMLPYLPFNPLSNFNSLHSGSARPPPLSLPPLSANNRLSLPSSLMPSVARELDLASLIFPPPTPSGMDNQPRPESLF